MKILPLPMTAQAGLWLFITMLFFLLFILTSLFNDRFNPLDNLLLLLCIAAIKNKTTELQRHKLTTISYIIFSLRFYVVAAKVNESLDPKEQSMTKNWEYIKYYVYRTELWAFFGRYEFARCITVDSVTIVSQDTNSCVRKTYPRRFGLASNIQRLRLTNRTPAGDRGALHVSTLCNTLFSLSLNLVIKTEM